jgi:hypothetical protein
VSETTLSAEVEAALDELRLAPPSMFTSQQWRNRHLATIRAALERSARIEAAAKALRDARSVVGREPRFHAKMMHALKRDWPTLWKALDASDAALDREDG